MSDAKAKFVGLGGERPDRYHKQSTKMLQHNGMMGWGIGECLFLLQILLFFFILSYLFLKLFQHLKFGEQKCALICFDWNFFKHFAQNS